MIQRIQTMFLLLAGIAFATVMLLPFATSDQTDIVIFHDREYTIADFAVLQILTYVAIVAVLIAIFMYKRRKVQLRVGYGIVLLGLLIPILAYTYYRSLGVSISGAEIGLGGMMPVVGVLCVLLANIFIRKDERLVKSMDRLR